MTYVSTNIWKLECLAGSLAFLLISLSSCERVGGPGTAAHTAMVVTTKTGVEMAVVPGGAFEMGSTRGANDEQPPHRVTIDSFLMDVYEVRQEELRRLQISDPSHFKDPNRPAEQVNWTHAAEFCNERSRAESFEPCYDENTWLCNLGANGYRLPTEAEWEYACRAGTSTEYSFGNNAAELAKSAWFKENSQKKTQVAGRKQPNPWGLCDMHGNVAEWCNDFYSPEYYGQSPEKNPSGPAQGKKRVLRGGGWNSSAESCRSSYRVGDASVDDTCLANDSIGFRCVRRPTPEELESNDSRAKTGDERSP